MEYVPDEKQPMRSDPPEFRVVRTHWYEPWQGDTHRAPVLVAFTICNGDRRAFSVTRDEAGRLSIDEYEEVIPDPDQGQGIGEAGRRAQEAQGPYAGRILYPDEGRAAHPIVVSTIGDAIDGWIVGGHLPLEQRR